MKQIKKQADNYWSMEDLMKDLGYLEWGNTCYCPFHADKEGGKRSAKVYDDTNTLYCFSEQRLYGPYDLLKLEGYSDQDIAEKLPENVPERNTDRDIKVDIDALDDLREEWEKGMDLNSFLHQLANILIN